MPLTDPITCSELIEFLASYLDGELAAERKQVFDAHLEDCPDCVAYVDSYRKTGEVIKRTLAACSDLPDDVPGDLLEAILAARGKH